MNASPMLNNTPRVILSGGEPAGVGPELCAMIAQQTFPCRLAIAADPDLLSERARAVGLALRPRILADDQALPEHEPGAPWVIPVRLRQPARAGALDPANAEYVLESIRLGVEACLSGRFDALVTPPAHKGVINDAGVPFSGHTEFIAELTGGFPVMLLAAEGLRVALVTTHLPLKAVSAAVTQERLTRVIEVLRGDLIRRFGLAQPRILVCGLNPHAGEGGHLGREEIEIIEPTLNTLRERGWDLRGPLPADTLFLPKHLDGADAVLAMYHDQGLPVLKHMGFGRAVNITLGLPIVRTSVDHGVALDLAGSGRADAGSLEQAIRLAQAMARADRESRR